ncbi:MAG: PHB depolymerase family esterase [Phycisphaerales bacterium]
MRVLTLAAVVLFMVTAGGCAARAHLTGGVEALAAHPPGEAGLLFREIRHEGVVRRYALYVPRQYLEAEAAERAWPLVVFLNGRGECGTDGSRQTGVGLGPAVLLNPERWACVILFPQKPDQASAWVDHEKMVLAMMERVRSDLRIDARRITLTGLSQGGAGTWAIGARNPELFAALAPVCGYGDAGALAQPLRNVPIWAFHGERDDIVRPEQTRKIVAAIEAGGGHPRATYFPEANHNSWDPAYRDPELARWLLEQQRTGGR